jgi:hypothetical protein
MHALMSALLANDHVTVEHLVEEIGIDEEQIKARGGGFYILIAVVVLLWATNAY